MKGKGAGRGQTKQRGQEKEKRSLREVTEESTSFGHDWLSSQNDDVFLFKQFAKLGVEEMGFLGKDNKLKY